MFFSKEFNTMKFGLIFKLNLELLKFIHKVIEFTKIY